MVLGMTCLVDATNTLPLSLVPSVGALTATTLAEPGLYSSFRVGKSRAICKYQWASVPLDGSSDMADMTVSMPCDL